MSGPDSITDAEVFRAVQGDCAARKRLLAAIGPQLRAMITVRLSPDPAQWHAVEDIAQQCLLDLAEGIERIKQPTETALKSFASTIAERRVPDFIRHTDPNKPIAQASLDATVPLDGSSLKPLVTLIASTGITPQSAAARAEAIAAVFSELGQLRPLYRQVIAMAFFDQLPLEEIATR